jgi:FKBP-type peptidyl-prolyl cis-trans isomerase 2
MKTRKGDFVEIEYIARIKDSGEIFDTNIEQEAKKIGAKDVKPLIICIGKDMVVKGLDKALENKEIGKKYHVEITSAEAFGKRDASLIRIAPMRLFKEKNMNPVPGMMLNLNNSLAKVVSVSGGRVSIDLNNPLAGKDIEYDFFIKRKVIDEKEKVNALQDFFFRQRFDFSMQENKIVFDKKLESFVRIFVKNLKDILGKEIVFSEKEQNNIPDNKQGKPQKIQEEKKEKNN